MGLYKNPKESFMKKRMESIIDILINSNADMIFCKKCHIFL